MPAAPDLERRLRIAGRTISRAGLAHAYGHCSLRLDDRHFLVSPSKPLGLSREGDHCHVLHVDEPIPAHVLGEVRIHREIYRRRPDVGGIVRAMPPHVMTLGACGLLPLPRHGFGAYFDNALELWDDPQLLREDDAAAALAVQLGGGRAILMRGNGCVVTGDTIEQAIVLTWYLEDMSRIEIGARALACPYAKILTTAECQQRATWAGAICERMFQHLSHGDIEGNRDEDTTI